MQHKVRHMHKLSLKQIVEQSEQKKTVKKCKHS